MGLAEQLGIPNPPKKPSMRDYQLARFVTDDLEKHPSGFCGRALLTASDGYGSSGAQCRKKGWVYRSGFGMKFKGCPAIYTYFLTDSGKIEAKAAVERIAAYKARVAEWTELFKAARARMIAEAAAQGIVTEGGDANVAPGAERVEPGPKDAPHSHPGDPHAQ